MPSPTRRSVLGLCACVALAAVGPAAGCLSVPTLPLPPPNHPDTEPLGDGRYRLTGEIPVGGVALARNVATDKVYGQETERYFDFIVLGTPGDRIRFWYIAGTDTSEAIQLVLPDEATADAGADAASDGAP